MTITGRAAARNAGSARAARERGRAPAPPGWGRQRIPAAGGVAVMAALLAAGGSWAGATRLRAGSRPTAATFSPSFPIWTVPGTGPLLRWPTAGEGAVAIAGVGLVGSSPHERRVPIASVTKMMTALVVLADHPLLPGQTGPVITIRPEDVHDYSTELHAGDSTVEVTAGETLTEYQLLEALLIPSGDNIADRLAIWDAGSIHGFVAKMNAMARSFELTSTRYADASGVDPRSSSTAAEQALVASKLIAEPVIRTIVRRQRDVFPVVGLIANRNPALRIDGIIGLKGGYSSEAHTCLVTAAFRSRHRVLVISVALGQPDPASAALIDERLLEAVTTKLERRRLTAPRATAGTMALPGIIPGVALVTPPKPSAAIVWPGLQLTEEITAAPGVSAETLVSSPAGSAVATMTVSAPWGVLATVPLRVAAPPPAPPSASLAGTAGTSKPAARVRQPADASSARAPTRGLARAVAR